MKRIFGFLTVAAFVGMLFATNAFAQSSGNFAASVGESECAIAAADGTFSGGIASVPDITVKVSGGSGVALVITPSLVTGLFTNNKITATSPTSTTNVGLEVRVQVDGSTALVAPEEGSDGVIYDQRFILISSSVIAGLSGCSALATTTAPACFQLVESTLSAHSFNFYVFGLTPGTHVIHTDWEVEPAAIAGTTAACVGPGVVTVTQVKNFSFDSGLSF